LSDAFLDSVFGVAFGLLQIALASCSLPSPFKHHCSSLRQALLAFYRTVSLGFALFDLAVVLVIAYSPFSQCCDMKFRLH